MARLVTDAAGSLARLADALLQDGELLKVRLAPLAMVLLELFQQAYLEVHIHRAAIDVVTLTLVFKVDVGQSGDSDDLPDGIPIKNRTRFREFTGRGSD